MDFDDIDINLGEENNKKEFSLNNLDFQANRLKYSLDFNNVNADDEWQNVPVIQGKVDYDHVEGNFNDQSINATSAIATIDVSNTPSVISPQANQISNLSFEILCTSLSELMQNEHIVSSSKHSSGFSIIRLIFGPPKLKNGIDKLLDEIYHLSSTSFNDQEETHLRMLKTIYSKLTNSPVYNRYGPHWESVGFQGNDPSTDLRGCGILSLVLIIYMLEPELFDLTQEIFRLSQHEIQNFPFCLVGINLTRVILDLSRRERLNDYFNKIPPSQGNQLIMACGRFLSALYLDFYLVWKNGNKSIKDFGFVIKDLEAKAKKSSKNLLAQLETHLKSNSRRNIERPTFLPLKQEKTGSNFKIFSRKSTKEPELEFTSLK